MAERNRVEELKKKLEPIFERILKKDDCSVEAIGNAIQIVLAVRELMNPKQINAQESGQTSARVEGIKDGERKENLPSQMESKLTLKNPESAQRRIKRHGLLPTPLPPNLDDTNGATENELNLVLMLRRLPSSSAPDDTAVMKDLRMLVTKSPAALALFGQFIWPTARLLNPTTIARAYSDASLQAVLLSVLYAISDLNQKAGSAILRECSNVVMPFLVACLISPISKLRRTAADALRAMSSVDANIRVIGESGVIRRLIRFIKTGEPRERWDAGRILLNLCRDVENRGRAISEGAVVVVADKVRSSVLVEEMLELLEMLSRHEKAVEELEEKEGMLQGLFMMLAEEGGERRKEYCMLVIHAMCRRTVARTRRVDEVENGRKILECVASGGTEKAREKATDLLSKLNLIDQVCKGR